MSLQAIPEAAAASLSAGIGIGHLTGRLWHRHKRTRDVLQGLVWAVGGKAADELGPRQPGLVDEVRELAEQVGAVRDRIDRHESWHAKD